VRERFAELVAAARAAQARSHSPYSRFAVGAALLGRSGRIYAGTNVENASFGLSICAERAAVCQAVAAGEREFLALAITTADPRPTPPCGACRQVLEEFAPALTVLLAGGGDEVEEWRLDALLPRAFVEFRGAGRAPAEARSEPGGRRERRGRRRRADLAGCLDHTLLRADAGRADVERLCREAALHRFAAVRVQPRWVPVCADLLAGSGVAVGAACGFPLGGDDGEAKAFAARRAVHQGAGEIAVMLPLGPLKGGDLRGALADIAAVRREVASAALLEVVLECRLLTDEEKVAAAAVALEGGADLVAAATGFGGGAASPADVRLLRRAVGEDVGVKAAGAIVDGAAAQELLAAGADRLGVEDAARLATAGAGPREGTL